MKKSVFIMTLFFIANAGAVTIPKDLKAGDFTGVQIQFNQPLSFGLGKYAEDSKAQVSKGEVQYIVSYDAVIKAKEEASSPFCTFSITKKIKHKTQDYAQASNEIIEILQQKKVIILEAKEILNVKEAVLDHAVIQLIIESRKESQILAECISPGAKEEDDPQPLWTNMLETLFNNQVQLRKKGKEFPPQENPTLKASNSKRKKS